MSNLALITKKVKIFSSTTSEVIELTTSATNYGAFQQDLQAAGLSLEKMNVVMRDQSGSRTALSFADTPLPQNDFVVLISPAMQKGALDLKTQHYNVLRKKAQELGINCGQNPKKEDLIRALTKHRGFKDTKSRKEKATQVTKFNEKVVEIKREFNLPVTERIAILKENFKALLKNNPAKAQVTALKEEAIAISDTIGKEGADVYAITNALCTIEEIISVEAEEVPNEEDTIRPVNITPSNRPSWIDNMSKEDAMKDFLR